MGYAPARGREARARLRLRRLRGPPDGDAARRRALLLRRQGDAELEFPGHECVLLLLRPTAWPPAEGAGSATVPSSRLPPSSRARGTRSSSRRRPATWTSRRPTSCSRSDAASARRRTCAVRGARRRDGRDALGLAPDRRRRLDDERAPGRPVRQDREAEGLPRSRASRAPCSTWPA